MAVSVKHVRFQKETTGVDGVNQDINVGFVPKAVIVFSETSASNNTAADHYQWSQGFSDGTTSRCITITSDDADAAADTQQVHSPDSGVVRMNETGNTNVVDIATISFSGTNVRFTWTISSTLGPYMHLLAFGGDDITNVKVGDISTNTTSTGTQDYTGLGFNPTDGNAVLFTLCGGITTLTNTSSLGASQTFGCAVSASKEWAVANTMEDTADPTDNWRVLYNNHCAAYVTRTTGALDFSAEFSAWITNGFRLNYTDAPSSSTIKISYLVINGGNWDAGTLTSPTATTANVDQAVSVSSNTIRGLLLASHGSPTATTILTESIISVGATDGTTQSCIGNIDEDAQATVDAYRINNNTEILRCLIANAGLGKAATFDSFSANNFRLDWTAGDGEAKLTNWVVVADSAGAPPAAVEDIFPHSFGTIQAFDNNIGPAIFGAGSEIAT